MRHHDWQDLIPYYVAGTLDAADTAALERHLVRCAGCRAAVAEWQDVAGLVHEAASAWAAETPPLPESVRAMRDIGPLPSSNGHENVTVPVRTIANPDEQSARRAFGLLRMRVPLTLAAAFAVLIVVGALMVYINTRSDENQADRFGDADESAMLPTFTLSTTDDTARASATPRPSRTPAASSTRLPSATPLAGDDLGILSAPGDLYQTPRAPVGMGGAGGAGDTESLNGVGGSLSTSTPVMPLVDAVCRVTPAYGERVAVYPAPYASTDNVFTWLVPGTYYHVISTNGMRDWYQVLVPQAGRSGWIQASAVSLYGRCGNLPVAISTPAFAATPTAGFSYQIGGGYHLLTTQPLDGIPSRTRVRISSAWYDGADWVYDVVTQDGRAAQARTWQLSVALAEPTPTSSLELGGGGYNWVTTARVGVLPANTRVGIGSAWFTGEEWIYQIVTRDGRAAEARAWQLTQSPDPDATATPTYHATPTAEFHDQLGVGYNLVTLEPVGNIPAGVRVRIGSAWYDGTYWHYNVSPQYNPSETANAYHWQLARVTLTNGTPTAPPLPSPSWTPSPTYAPTAQP